MADETRYGRSYGAEGVTGAGPAELEARALTEARLFFGDGVELAVRRYTAYRKTPVEDYLAPILYEADIPVSEVLPDEPLACSECGRRTADVRGEPALCDRERELARVLAGGVPGDG